MGVCQIVRTVPYYQGLEKLFELRTQKLKAAIGMCSAK